MHVSTPPHLLPEVRTISSDDLSEVLIRCTSASMQACSKQNRNGYILHRSLHSFNPADTQRLGTIVPAPPQYPTASMSSTFAEGLLLLDAANVDGVLQTKPFLNLCTLVANVVGRCTS
jgi:hypothetical protein